MGTISITKATQKDIGAITDIRNEAIVEKIATLDEKKHSIKYEQTWLKDHPFPFGVWIAKQNKIILGWVSLNKFSQRSVYQFVADLSVYVAHSARGKGVGTMLLEFVIKKAKENGFHKIVLSGFPFNIPAKTLYKKFGFSTVGIYKEQGKLNKEWVDVILMEKLL